MNSIVTARCTILALIMVAACNPIKPLVHDEPAVDVHKEIQLPTRIAILPFANATSNPSAGTEMRRVFYNFFSSLNYHDTELYSIDQLLVQNQLYEAVVNGEDLPWQTICQKLGIDGFITGKVNDYGKVYALIYTQTKVSMEARLQRCSDGADIWQNAATEVERDGDIPLTPTGLAAALVTTYMSHHNTTALQVAAKLSIRLSATIPNPPTLLPPPPNITLMIHNAAGQLLRPGKALKVVLIGDPGHTGSWDIPGIAENLPLAEKDRGIYVGQYTVKPGDRTPGVQLVSRLVNQANVENRWVDIMEPVAMGVPTELPSVIENDLVLTADKSPYIISDIVLVKQNANLIIQPGITIWSDGLGLIVNGRLNAEGEVDNKILFASIGNNPWKGIAINNPLSSSKLHYVEVRNADIGLNLRNTSVSASRLVLSGNQWGIVTQNSTLDLLGSIIRDSGKVGLSARNSTVSMQHNHITNNETGGAQFKQTRLTLVNNALFDNGAWDLKNLDTTTIEAGHNWWGTSAAEKVRTSGSVQIAPLLPEPLEIK